MKRLLLPCLASALIVLSAWAQDPLTVCQRASDGTCTWVQQDADVLQDWIAFEQGTPYVSPHSDEPATVFFEWQAEHPAADPLIKVLGTCARRPEYARSRFVVAMESNDLNRLLGTYNWRGKTDSDAEGLIERLNSLPPSGQWQKTVVSSSFGEESDMEKAPTHWRWSDGAALTNFKMVRVDGCWFVEFSSDPGQSAILHKKGSPSSPRRDPSSSEPGVFDF
jgi:hypothetical protein